MLLVATSRQRAQCAQKRARVPLCPLIRGLKGSRPSQIGLSAFLKRPQQADELRTSWGSNFQAGSRDNDLINSLGFTSSEARNGENPVAKFSQVAKLIQVPSRCRAASTGPRRERGARQQGGGRTAGWCRGNAGAELRTQQLLSLSPN